MEQVEAAAKALEIAALLEGAWADFKEEADEWEEALEVAEMLDVDLATLADDLVTDIAKTAEAQVEDSALIDAGAWYAVYEDVAAGAFDEMDLSSIES